jgi:hypothetical protein
MIDPTKEGGCKTAFLFWDGKLLLQIMEKPEIDSLFLHGYHGFFQSNTLTHIFFNLQQIFPCQVQ